MQNFRFNTDGIELTKSEEKIVDYIYKNISRIPFLSIGQISGELNIGIATLSRFVRHVGYNSYKDLKASIVEHRTNTTPAGKLKSTLMEPDSSSIENLLLRQETYIASTRENLSSAEIAKSVQAIKNAENIYLFGKGASAGLAELLAFRLNRFGKRIVRIHSSGSQVFEDMVNITDKDLVIIFGFYKMPVEAEIILDFRGKAGYKTLLFTDRLYASADQQGDINLYVYRGEQEEYHSMSAPTAVIDALVILTAKELGNDSIEKLSSLYNLKEKYSDRLPR